MESFKIATINEIEKMYHKKKVVITGLLTIFIITFGQLIVSFARTKLGILTASSTEFPLMVLSVLNNTILPLFCALMTIDVFTGELSHNLMKLTLLRPVCRYKIYLSKIVAVCTYILGTLLAVYIMSTLAGLLFNPLTLSLSFLLKVFVAYIITLVPFIGLTAFIAFISNILKSSTSAFFVSIVVFLGFKGAEILFPKVSSLFITSSINWYSLFLAHDISYLRIGINLLTIIGYGIIFLTLGLSSFEKKDF